MADNLPNPRPPIAEKPMPPGGPMSAPGNPGFPASANVPAGRLPKPVYVKPGQTVTQSGKSTGSWVSQAYYSNQQQQARPGRHLHHPITGAANAAGLIRITAPAHTLATNNVVDIGGVLGTVEANRTGWTITVIDANSFDLVGSTFTNAYVSGGSVSLQ